MGQSKAARAFVRWNPARQHHRLPDLHGGAGFPDAQSRHHSYHPYRTRARLLRHARERIWLLPDQREDPGPLFSGLPELLESGRLLSLLSRRTADLQLDRAHGARRDGVYTDKVHLSQSDGPATPSDPDAGHSLGGADDRNAADAADDQFDNAWRLAQLHRLLLPGVILFARARDARRLI